MVQTFLAFYVCLVLVPPNPPVTLRESETDSERGEKERGDRERTRERRERERKERTERVTQDGALATRWSNHARILAFFLLNPAC